MIISRRERMQYHLMLLPAVVLVLFMNLIPMGGIILAFKDFNIRLGIYGSEWSGFDKFQTLIENPQTLRIIVNTMVISIGKILMGLVIPLCFAIALNEVRSKFFKSTVQTIVFLPHFLSWVAIAGILRDLMALDGLFNHALGWFGVEPSMLLGDPTTFPMILVLTETWKEFGFGAVIYLAALAGISPALYEAADMDGATRWEKIRHITIPSLVPTIIMLAALNLQNVLNGGFDQVFNLYNSMVMDTGDIIDTYVYRMGLENLQYELATAVGLFKSLISMGLIIAGYQIAKKYANYRIF